MFLVGGLLIGRLTLLFNDLEDALIAFCVTASHESFACVHAQTKFVFFAQQAINEVHALLILIRSLLTLFGNFKQTVQN